MMDGDFELDSPLEGRTLGRVIDSRDPALPEGEIVLHRHGWRTHSVVTPRRDADACPHLDGVPLSAYLSILGGTGLTAYVGLTRIARLREGEDLFVSGGRGRGRHGHRAASPGCWAPDGSSAARASAAKVGVPDANTSATTRPSTTTTGPVADLLAKAAPDGIDVFVDNVGGDHLGARDRRAARARADRAGRHDRPVQHPGRAARRASTTPTSWRRACAWRASWCATTVDVQEELYEFAVPHLHSGRLALDETVVDGFERIVDAFLSMLRGGNTGKMIVRAA